MRVMIARVARVFAVRRSASAGTTSASDGAAIYASPTELASARTSDDETFGWLAVLELLALVLLPGLYVVTMRRRRPQTGARP